MISIFLQWKCNYWAWHLPTKKCKLVKSLSLTCQDDDEYFDRCTGGDVDEEWITGDRLCNVEKGFVIRDIEKFPGLLFPDLQVFHLFLLLMLKS